MEGLIKIFKEVRAAHEKEVQKLMAQGKHPLAKLTPKKEAVSILLSPSDKFSGPLIRVVFTEFEAHLKQTNSDAVVVGQTGKELLQSQLKKNLQFQYFSINLNNPTDEELRQLLSYVIQYKDIMVFTGKFQSLLTQLPTSFNITGYNSLRSEAAAVQPNHSFLFEPAIEEIIGFFDTQVTASLFRRTVAESKLANLGSRIMSLEESRSNITRELELLHKHSYRLRRQVANRKQLQRISGLSLWQAKPRRSVWI